MRVALAAAIAGTLLAPAALGQSDYWTGTWNVVSGGGNQYVYEFTQSGSSVTGTERGAGSTEELVIEGGTVDSNGVLRFTTGDGRYRYQFTPYDNGTFTGAWGYDTEEAAGTYSGGTYNGSRQVDALAGRPTTPLRFSGTCTAVGGAKNSMRFPCTRNTSNVVLKASWPWPGSAGQIFKNSSGVFCCQIYIEQSLTGSFASNPKRCNPSSIASRNCWLSRGGTAVTDTVRTANPDATDRVVTVRYRATLRGTAKKGAQGKRILQVSPVVTVRYVVDTRF